MDLLKINLLPSSVKQIRKTNQNISLLRLISEIVLALFVIFAVGLFGMFFLTSQQISSLSQRKSLVVSELEALAGQEILYRRFVTVIESAKKLTLERKNFKEMLDEIYTLIPEGSFITDLQFIDEGVLLTITSENVHGFGLALARIGRINSDTSLFGDVILNDVSRSLDGKYVFALQLSANKQTNGNS